MNFVCIVFELGDKKLTLSSMENLIVHCNHQIFISLYLKAFIQSLVQINTVFSENIRFEFLYVHDLGPRSRNGLDLQYSHIFIKSICLRSLAAIVSEIPLFSLFPIEKPVIKFDLAVK